MSVVAPGGRRIEYPGTFQADASGNFWSSFSVYRDLRLVNVGIYWAQYCVAGTRVTCRRHSMTAAYTARMRSIAA